MRELTMELGELEILVKREAAIRTETERLQIALDEIEEILEDKKLQDNEPVRPRSKEIWSRGIKKLSKNKIEETDLFYFFQDLVIKNKEELRIIYTFLYAEDIEISDSDISFKKNNVYLDETEICKKNGLILYVESRYKKELNQDELENFEKLEEWEQKEILREGVILYSYED